MRGNVDTDRYRPCEDTGRRLPSMSQGKKSGTVPSPMALRGNRPCHLLDFGLLWGNRFLLFKPAGLWNLSSSPANEHSHIGSAWQNHVTCGFTLKLRANIQALALSFQRLLCGPVRSGAEAAGQSRVELWPWERHEHPLRSFLGRGGTLWAKGWGAENP